MVSLQRFFSVSTCLSLSVSQSTAVGPVGPVGLSVLVPVSMTSVVMFPPRGGPVPAPPPSRLMTPRLLVIVAPETATRCRPAASCPTVQVRQEPVQDLRGHRVFGRNLLCSVWLSAVDGSWGAWSPFRPCSTTCGEGLQVSMRACDAPPPKYGGRLCDGASARTSVCQNPCPGNKRV